LRIDYKLHGLDSRKKLVYSGRLLRTLERDFVPQGVNHPKDWLIDILRVLKRGDYHAERDFESITMRLEVTNVTYASEEIRYFDHMERVKISLRKEVMAKQLATDIMQVARRQESP